MKNLKKNQSNIDWEVGSKNVFADLGMPNSEEMLIKADLVLKINKIIAKKNLTQVEAAVLLRVDQSKISLLARGRLTAFSIERLIKFLTLLHQDIEIVVKNSHQKTSFGKLRVKYA